jgi:hypothetical protein
MIATMIIIATAHIKLLPVLFSSDIFYNAPNGKIDTSFPTWQFICQQGNLKLFGTFLRSGQLADLNFAMLYVISTPACGNFI